MGRDLRVGNTENTRTYFHGRARGDRRRGEGGGRRSWRVIYSLKPYTEARSYRVASIFRADSCCERFVFPSGISSPRYPVVENGDDNCRKTTTAPPDGARRPDNLARSSRESAVKCRYQFIFPGNKFFRTF